MTLHCLFYSVGAAEVSQIRTNILNLLGNSAELTSLSGKLTVEQFLYLLSVYHLEMLR